MTRKKMKFAAGFAVILVCLLYLVVSGFQQTAMYYLTVSELAAQEVDFVGKRIKLAGRVVPKSIQVDDRNLAVQFLIWEPMEDASKGFSGQRAVRYKGIVPDTFKDGSDVILEGKPGPDGVFQAETLLAKCPSKYEGKSYEEMKEVHGEE